MNKAELIAALAHVPDDAELIIFPFAGPRSAGALHVVQVLPREVVDGVEFLPTVCLEAGAFR
jgi:hypothetical protein